LLRGGMAGCGDHSSGMTDYSRCGQASNLAEVIFFYQPITTRN